MPTFQQQLRLIHLWLAGQRARGAYVKAAPVAPVVHWEAHRPAQLRRQLQSQVGKVAQFAGEGNLRPPVQPGDAGQHRVKVFIKAQFALDGKRRLRRPLEQHALRVTERHAAGDEGCGDVVAGGVAAAERLATGVAGQA
eukprot:ctg_2757.g589